MMKRKLDAHGNSQTSFGDNLIARLAYVAQEASVQLV